MNKIKRHTVRNTHLGLPVQKKEYTQKIYIKEKVQAYFKHLCALKIKKKIRSKNDMSVYNQNLPYSIFLWRKKNLLPL